MLRFGADNTPRPHCSGQNSIYPKHPAVFRVASSNVAHELITDEDDSDGGEDSDNDDAEDEENEGGCNADDFEDDEQLGYYVDDFGDGMYIELHKSLLHGENINQELGFSPLNMFTSSASLATIGLTVLAVGIDDSEYSVCMIFALKIPFGIVFPMILDAICILSTCLTVNAIKPCTIGSVQRFKRIALTGKGQEPGASTILVTIPSIIQSILSTINV